MSLLSSNIKFPFFAPDVPTPGISTGAGPTGMGKEDIIEFLSSDDEEKPELIDVDDKKKPAKEKDDKQVDDKSDDKEDTEEEEEEPEEEDELSEIEKELEEGEEPDEKKFELVTPARRRDILKKYPKLFEDFPYLEKAYYREQQYTELLPTIEDAKEAIDKSETLDKFENELSQGNTETMLKAIKNSNPRIFNKVVDDYLTTLYNVDEKAYNHVLGNTIKHTIMQMVGEGRKANNETLLAAAQVLNQFVFGTSDFHPPANLFDGKTPEVDPREKELNERDRSFRRARFEEARDSLDTRVNNSIKSTIETHIDTNGAMTDYIKRNAVREATERIERLIDKDTRFKTIVDKLWEKAAEKNFDKESVDKIRSAYLSKAKTLLLPVIKEARNEALKGMGKRTPKEDKNDTPDKRNRNTNKDDDQPRSRKNDGKKVPNGMSSLEYLMSED